MIRFKPCTLLMGCLFFAAMALPARAANHYYSLNVDIDNTVTWNAGDSVTVRNSGAGDITVVVQDVNVTDSLDTLTITAESSGNANMEFTSQAPHTTFAGDVTLTGSASGGIATLEIQNDASIAATGRIEVGNNAALVVHSGGSLTVSDLTSITNGTLTIESGATQAWFAGVTLSGSTAVMNVGADVMLTGGQTIALTSGGTLNVVGDATINGSITNSGGNFNVNVGVSLIVDGVVTSSAGSAGTSPTYGTTITGNMTANGFSIGGGAALIAGTVNSNSVQITTGQLDISGEMNEATVDGGIFTISGGTVNVQTGGTVDTTSITLSGSSILNVQGTVAGGGTVDATGGTVNVTDGGELGSASDALDSLTVSGSGTAINIEGTNSELNTASLAFSGGAINVTDGGYLSADSVSAFAGAMRIDDGSASFIGGLQVGSGGSVTVGSGGASIALGTGATMTVASGGTFNLSAGNASVWGDLTISSGGSYIAGYNNSTISVNLATVTGTADLSSGALVQMSLDLQAYVNSVINDLSTSPVTILEASTVSAGTLSWSSGSYQYIYGIDSSGNLAVVAAFAIDEETRYQNLIELWNRNPDTHGQAARIIDRTFGKAITDGHAIRVGDPTRYNGYSLNGRSNIDVLAGFADETTVTAMPTAFSGLVLYSGLGLNHVNRAVLESTGSITRRVIRRNDAVRHELALAAASLDPDLAACLDNPANRLWVDGTYQRDHQSRDGGLPGYKYNPRGVTLGYDRILGNQAVLGAALAYAGGDFEDLSALANDSRISTYAALLYGSYNHPSGLYLSGALGYAYSDNDIRDYRQLAGELGWNRAEYHNTTLMAAVRLGMDFEPVDYLVITPSVGFSYQGSRGSDHNQFFTADSPGSGFNTLTVGEMKNHSATIPFEVRIGYDLFAEDDSLLNLSVLAGYAYETHNKGVSGSFGYGGLDDFGRFTPLGEGAGRHIVNLGIGAKYLYKQYEFSLDYDYYGRSGLGSHGFMGRIGISF